MRRKRSAVARNFGARAPETDKKLGIHAGGGKVEIVTHQWVQLRDFEVEPCVRVCPLSSRGFVVTGFANQRATLALAIIGKLAEPLEP